MKHIYILIPLLTIFIPAQLCAGFSTGLVKAAKKRVVILDRKVTEYRASAEEAAPAAPAAASAPIAAFSFFPASPAEGDTLTFTDTSSGSPTSWAWTFGDGGTSAAQNPTHSFASAGSYTVSLTATNALGSNQATQLITVSSVSLPYIIVDTAQTAFYNATGVISAPASSGDAFYGQDAQFSGNQPSYTDNGDGTVTDLHTGLMWVQAMGSAVTLSAAQTGAASCSVGGYSDWRLPTVKELYSLMKFSGVQGASMTDASDYIPFIDTTTFNFSYGPGTGLGEGERVIDVQNWSSTVYVSTTVNNDATQFGVNFADGHVKGYPIYTPGTGTPQTHYVRYVRGNTSYGANDFLDNGDGTVTDRATGLMWTQADSGSGMDWQSALAWAQTKNAANHLGHNDWRLPNVKELHSIIDYTRSPSTTGTAAIDPVFSCTQIVNEGGIADYPFYWTGTTFVSGDMSGIYLSFGRALGWMKMGANSYYSLVDAHGAGAQRSDPKSGSYTSFPLGVDIDGNPVYGRGPQGDVVRINNYVRLVRDAD